MNVRLDPPSVRPLDPARSARLRNGVMDRTAPVRRSGRRWAIPLVTAAAVGAVLAGTLVAFNHEPGSVEAPLAGAVGVIQRDLGPAGTAEIEATLKICMMAAPREELKPVWSRRVLETQLGKEVPTTVVLVRRTSRTAADGAGLWFCMGTVPMAPGVEEKAFAKEPTPAQGIVTLARMGGARELPSGEVTPKFGRMTKASESDGSALHRVRPEITRLQSRYVWKGGAGPWSEGAVAAGLAFTQSTAKLPPSPGQVREEFRAYDAAGNEVKLRY